MTQNSQTDRTFAAVAKMAVGFVVLVLVTIGVGLALSGDLPGL